MRRVLLILLAFPAHALAQSAGTIALPTGEDTINVAQCTGTRNEVRDGEDELTIELSWTTDIGTGTFTPGGKYQLWATNRTPGTKETGVTSCSDPAVAGAGYVAGKVGAEIDAPTQTISNEEYSLQDIAAAVGQGACTAGTSTTIHLCVQWLPSGGSVGGFAAGASLALDLASPSSPPSDVNVRGGERSLRVSCSGGDSASTFFKAKATSGTGEPRWSSEQSSCDGLQITGLENGQTYSVVVYGLDDSKNPSPPSAAFEGTPVPTDDFYDRYERQGGQETGGCSTATGAVGLLSAFALLALRRRKP